MTFGDRAAELVRRSPSRCTSRTSRGRATSDRCDCRARRRAGRASTTRRVRAAATFTTAGSAAASPRSAGRCTSTPCRVPGRVRTRPRAPRWPTVIAAIPDGAVVLRRRPDRLAVPEVAGRPRRVGCGWSSWCTCRWATGRRVTVLDDARAGERAVLSAAAAVVTTSSWTRSGCSTLRLPSGSVHVAEPGVDAAEPARRTPPPAAQLLCVAAVTPAQGARRVAGGVGDARRPAVALRVRGHVEPRPELRRRPSAPGTGERDRRPGPFHRPVDRRRPR